MKNRNSKNQLFFGVFALLSALSAHDVFAEGGSHAGNGGEAYVCFGALDPVTHLREVLSAKLADYQEVSKLKVNLGSGSVEEKIETALKRLERVDLSRAKKIRAKIQEMNKSENTYFLSRFRDQQVIQKLKDSNLLFEPAAENCATVQIAVNLTKPGPYQYRYYIMKDYFDAHSPQDQAGLYLHEALYNIEADLGATSSDGVREQVRLMSSPEIQNLSAFEYLSFIRANSPTPSVTAANGSFFELAKDGDNKKILISEKDPHFVLQGTAALNQDYSSIAFFDYRLGTDRYIPMDVRMRWNNWMQFVGNSSRYAVKQGGEVRLGAFYFKFNESVQLDAMRNRLLIDVLYPKNDLGDILYFENAVYDLGSQSLVGPVRGTLKKGDPLIQTGFQGGQIHCNSNKIGNRTFRNPQIDVEYSTEGVIQALKVYAETDIEFNLTEFGKTWTASIQGKSNRYFLVRFDQNGRVVQFGQ